ncbi:MAG: AraC family transcriptional regulator [Desulfotomaculaceae bacterium]|nr:AraC family transcriptional regulator [Desulfotomaculaceae bacterium]
MPVRAYVRCVEQYPFHWHKAMEVIYVLEGQAYLGIGGETHLLTENNIAVINGYELHWINKSGGGNKLLIMQMDTDFCERINPDFPYTFIYCCSPYHEDRAPEKYNALKEHILRMACLLNEEPGQNHKTDVKGCLEEILIHMIGSFDYLRFGPGIIAFKEKQVHRYKKIFEHIRKSPVENHSLEELAEVAGVTLQHMCHDIKDKFGLSLQELLYYGKCEHAARLLLSTDKTIYKISAECGFSDPKYLIKHFKLNYHSTPSEFRKMYRADGQTLALQVRYEEAPLFSVNEYLGIHAAREARLEDEKTFLRHSERSEGA